MGSVAYFIFLSPVLQMGSATYFIFFSSAAWNLSNSLRHRPSSSSSELNFGYKLFLDYWPTPSKFLLRDPIKHLLLADWLCSLNVRSLIKTSLALFFFQFPYVWCCLGKPTQYSSSCLKKGHGTFLMMEEASVSSQFCHSPSIFSSKAHRHLWISVCKEGLSLILASSLSWISIRPQVPLVLLSSVV